MVQGETPNDVEVCAWVRLSGGILQGMMPPGRNRAGGAPVGNRPGQKRMPRQHRAHRGGEDHAHLKEAGAAERKAVASLPNRWQFQRS